MTRRAANKSIVIMSKEFIHVFGIKLASIWYGFGVRNFQGLLMCLNMCSFTCSVLEACCWHCRSHFWTTLYLQSTSRHFYNIFRNSIRESVFSVPTKVRLWGRCNIRWVTQAAQNFVGLCKTSLVRPRFVAGRVREHEVTQLWAAASKLSS